MERCLGGAKPTTDHPVATGLVGLFGPRVKAPAQWYQNNIKQK